MLVSRLLVLCKITSEFCSYEVVIFFITAENAFVCSSRSYSFVLCCLNIPNDSRQVIPREWVQARRTLSKQTICPHRYSVYVSEQKTYIVNILYRTEASRNPNMSKLLLLKEACRQRTRYCFLRAENANISKTGRYVRRYLLDGSI